MNSAQANTARLLFVLSNDYGELSNALYLLKGGAFSPLLLMPDRLYAVNKDSLTVPARRYSGLADVIAVVEQERPDIVFLFSGYLYVINNNFDLESLQKLVDALRAHPCRLVTSDPFLGLMARIEADTFSGRHPAKASLTDLFAKVFAALRDVPHLYLVDLGATAPVCSVCFFNPRILADEAARQEHSERLGRELDIAEPERIWLFVLSSEDYGYQSGVYGKARFEELLIGQLRHAAGAGRRPVLIAPQPCIASLSGQASLPDTAILLSFCGHDRFISLLLAAECAFYWNIFSNSVLVRILNQLPVFFFAYGHMAHAIPPLLAAGRQHYYAASELPFLRSEQTLAPEELAQLAARQQQTLEPARQLFRRAPTPQEMVEKLLLSSPGPK